MDKNEEYVRSVWTEVAVSGVLVGVPPLPYYLYGWEHAAEFTRERKEKVRQLREEIALALHEYKKASVCGVSLAGPTGKALTWSRLLARVEAELTRLTAGMKPEAL